jgi:hypothetical protein
VYGPGCLVVFCLSNTCLCFLYCKSVGRLLSLLAVVCQLNWTKSVYVFLICRFCLDGTSVFLLSYVGDEYSATVARCVCNTHYSHSLRSCSLAVSCPHTCLLPTSRFSMPACSKSVPAQMSTWRTVACQYDVISRDFSCTLPFFGVVNLPLTSMNCDVNVNVTSMWMLMAFWRHVMNYCRLYLHHCLMLSTLWPQYHVTQWKNLCLNTPISACKINYHKYRSKNYVSMHKSSAPVKRIIQIVTVHVVWSQPRRMYIIRKEVVRL